MSNRRRTLAGLAASVALAAAGLGATPAPAQTGGGGYSYGCYDPNSGSAGGGYGNGYGYGTGYGCCQYDVYWGGWYIMYATHWEPCPPPSYQSPDQPDDRASEEPAKPSQ